MRHAGNIFLYNNNNINKTIYHENLEKLGYYLFDTDNLYKFTLYNKEITPNIILFDFAPKTSTNFITSLEHRFERSDIPIIVVSEEPKALIYHPSISHYITHDEAQKEINNIIETYCIGNKNHQILYINLKPYEKSDFYKSIQNSKYSTFEVHTINAAQTYLQKNTPSIICTNFHPALSKSKKIFSFPNTFYVENTQNIKEFEQFLH